MLLDMFYGVIVESVDERMLQDMGNMDTWP